MVSFRPPTDRPLSENELQALICNLMLQDDGRGLVQIPQFIRREKIRRTSRAEEAEAQMRASWGCCKVLGIMLTRW